MPLARVTSPMSTARSSAARTPVTMAVSTTAASSSGQGSRRRTELSVSTCTIRAASSSANGFGSRRGVFGLATPGMGEPASCSSETRYSKKPDQVECARRTVAAALPVDQEPKALRITRRVRSPTRSSSTGRFRWAAAAWQIAARSRSYAERVCGESLRGARARNQPSIASTTKGVRSTCPDVSGGRRQNAASSAGHEKARVQQAFTAGGRHRQQVGLLHRALPAAVSNICRIIPGMWQTWRSRREAVSEEPGPGSASVTATTCP